MAMRSEWDITGHTSKGNYVSTHDYMLWIWFSRGTAHRPTPQIEKESEKNQEKDSGGQTGRSSTLPSGRKRQGPQSRDWITIPVFPTCPVW